MLRRFLQRLFRALARRYVRRFRPVVIAITGTVGKTSAREAVAAVLATTLRTRTALKNYNNEWGVPFTILDVDGAGGVFGVARALLVGVWRAYGPGSGVDALVLEFGVDAPGDMDYLTSVAPLDFAVVTALGDIPVHVERFPSRERLWEEKLAIAKGVKPQGTLFYNADDVWLRRKTPLVPCRHRAYGLWQEAGIRAEAVEPLTDAGGLPAGLRLRVAYPDASPVTLEIPRLAGTHQVATVLAAASVAWALKVPQERVRRALATLESRPGRLRFLTGVKRTWVLDDTYNASPTATAAALVLLRACAPRRRIAVLGDMLELGHMSEEAHLEAGRLAATACDVLVAVGERAAAIAQGAMEGGLAADKVHRFALSTDAGKPVERMLREGDVVLVKGSQGMRMEVVVEEIMGEPRRAGALLVRQSPGWKETPVAKV